MRPTIPLFITAISLLACGSDSNPLIGTWSTSTVPTTLDGLVLDTISLTVVLNANETMQINGQLGFAAKAVINTGCTQADSLKGTWSSTTTSESGTLALSIDDSASTQLNTSCSSSTNNTPNGVAAGLSPITLGIFNGLDGHYTITGNTLVVDASLPVVGATTLTFARQN